MREAKMSLDQILDGFDPSEAASSSEFGRGRCVTIWLPAGYKEEYDKLQRSTHRRFAKTVRAILQVTIDKAKAKTG